MPLENPRRCPRLVSWRGMNASSAWKLARRGKSAKLVLAARTRISSVISCTMKNGAPPPSTPLAIWEITVFCSVGTTCIFEASHDMPRNIVPSSTPITIRVERAFFHSGGLKAGTPLEIASTPVIAAPPEAKACSSRNTLIPFVPRSSPGSAGGTWWRCPVAAFTMPTRMINITAITNP